MTPITRELARFAVNSRFDAMPPNVRHEGLRAFVNFVGCAAGGAKEEVVTKIKESKGPGSLLLSNMRTCHARIQLNGA